MLCFPIVLTSTVLPFSQWLATVDDTHLRNLRYSNSIIYTIIATTASSGYDIPRNTDNASVAALACCVP